ncbi:MAG: hypothetical protein K9M81_01255 [Chthoniobacterales bacterium]|nr:hypothetical protein [Chthoniobacterales bacterium]
MKYSGLTRIFHTNLLRGPGSQMDAGFDSHFDLDSMYTQTARHQNARPPYPISLRGLLVTISMKYPG